MKIFLITLVVFVLAVALMAMGVLLGNRRIKGSCGGLAGLKDGEGRSICDICTRPSPDCTGENARTDKP